MPERRLEKTRSLYKGWETAGDLAALAGDGRLFPDWTDDDIASWIAKAYVLSVKEFAGMTTQELEQFVSSPYRMPTDGAQRTGDEPV